MANERSLQNAVALAYGSGDLAPRVIAKGRGLIAEEIIRRAKDAGVYVHQSDELVALLMGLDLDQYIPPEFYVVVAELLAWLHRLERAAGAASPPEAPAQDPGIPPETAGGTRV